jgi:hypothetical protein
MIKKETIHELVEVFYQPPFKTFYINSLDGQAFSKSLGVFVSLGITTSMKTLQDIKEVLQKTSGYNAALVEIKSQKVAGQFLNTVIEKPETEVTQYEMTEYPEKWYSEEESKKLLQDMKEAIEKGETTATEYAGKVTRLEELIKKLDWNYPGGWVNHVIQVTPDGDYKIFHKMVNYRQDPTDGVEYRIGIYVTEKE